MGPYSIFLFPLGSLELVTIHIVFLYEIRKGIRSELFWPTLFCLLKGIYPVKKDLQVLLDINSGLLF